MRIFGIEFRAKKAESGADEDRKTELLAILEPFSKHYGTWCSYIHLDSYVSAVFSARTVKAVADINISMFPKEERALNSFRELQKLGGSNVMLDPSEFEARYRQGKACNVMRYYPELQDLTLEDAERAIKEYEVQTNVERIYAAKKEDRR